MFSLRRSPQAPGKSTVEGEPPASTATVTPPVETPSVEQLEEMFEAPAAPEVLERPRLRDRLGRTRSAFTGAFGRMRGRKVDDETWDELEEALLLADVGMATTDASARRGAARGPRRQSVTEPDELIALVRDEVIVDARTATAPIASCTSPRASRTCGCSWASTASGRPRRSASSRRKRSPTGSAVVLAAADTFRAAAADQLQLWAERTGGEIVRGQEGADPGSIVFDAMAAASSRRRRSRARRHRGPPAHEDEPDGGAEEAPPDRRPHRRRVARRCCSSIDASTGQNGLVQAKQFADAVDVTGIVLTKLDGTAKGGIVLAIQSELGIPVKVVGVGEGVGDLIDVRPAGVRGRALFGGRRAE